ncbi:MAG: carbamate kinase [Humibacillus sp.]|nr:carbamate kinase [Humibacillus sp.]MDN5775920.1 carbamate kinase [Humibacillus sp.]
MRIVIALGGNALLKRGQTPDAAIQVANVETACRALAPLAREHEIVITHGNGPQVGVLALQSASDPNLTIPYPFDTLGAMTQGMIGYWMLQSLQNNLPGRDVAAIINQTLVMESDPAFDHPTKFVGEVYTEQEAVELTAARGWVMKPDGEHFRRVVGSPRPQRVIETKLIRSMLDDGTVVVCAGGGGIPVVRDEHGNRVGVEAVVDKDLTAAVLAEHLDADLLMILTDVPAVIDGFGTDAARPIHRATPKMLRAMDFPDGSMGPKVEAVCRFVELTGGISAIGRFEDAVQLVAGLAGTVVTPGGDYGGVRDNQVPVTAATNGQKVRA